MWVYFLERRFWTYDIAISKVTSYSNLFLKEISRHHYTYYKEVNRLFNEDFVENLVHSYIQRRSYWSGYNTRLQNYDKYKHCLLPIPTQKSAVSYLLSLQANFSRNFPVTFPIPKLSDSDNFFMCPVNRERNSFAGNGVWWLHSSRRKNLSLNVFSCFA